MVILIKLFLFYVLMSEEGFFFVPVYLSECAVYITVKERERGKKVGGL